MSRLFAFEVLPLSTTGDVISAKLGVDADNKFVTNDLGKAVKLAANNNYVPVADGDEIEGFVVSVEPFTDNGFSFGSVQKRGRIEAEVGTGTVSVGTHVVAHTPVALGTAGKAKVKPGTAAAQAGTDPFAYTVRTPNTFIWRVLRIVSGNGGSGSVVLIERV